MVHDAWRAVVILLKGAGVLVAILAVLGVVGVIWLTLNPPFASPKTGQLHATATHDLTIGAGQATLAVRLEAKLNDNAMRTPNGQPGPPMLNAKLSPTPTGSLDGVRLSLAPGDATGPSSVVRATVPGQLDWAMPCTEGVGRPCRQVVVLLIEAAPAATERKLRLSVQGDLQYPTFTPTPGWSSFDLDLRLIGAPAGMGPNPVADAGGTIDLSMSRPVIVVPVHVEAGAAPASATGLPPAALRLSLETKRVIETAPAGFDAPEPVRATVLAADGTIVARLGARPGEAPSLSFVPGLCDGACSLDYRIAFEWMDRQPDAEYRLSWHAEVTGLPADDRAAVPVALRAGDPEVAEVAGTTIAPGAGSGPLRAQRLDVSVGGLPPADVGATPVHVQMLVTGTVDAATEIGADTVHIEPYPVAGRGGLAVPFDIGAGQTGAVALNLEDGCLGTRCDQWALQSSMSVPFGANPSGLLEVTWQVEVRAWRLVPDEAPLALTLDVR
jgi:hypothetical protein